MHVRVYLTDLPLPAREIHPLAIVRDVHEPQLPQHPEGLIWRYWVTTDTRDTLLDPLRPTIEAAIEREGHCLLYEPLDRLLSPLPLNAFRYRQARLPRSKHPEPMNWNEPTELRAA
jgi:hypothetical protein